MVYTLPHRHGCYPASRRLVWPGAQGCTRLISLRKLCAGRPVRCSMLVAVCNTRSTVGCGMLRLLVAEDGHLALGCTSMLSVLHLLRRSGATGSGAIHSRIALTFCFRRYEMHLSPLTHDCWGRRCNWEQTAQPHCRKGWTGTNTIAPSVRNVCRQPSTWRYGGCRAYSPYTSSASPTPPPTTARSRLLYAFMCACV